MAAIEIRQFSCLEDNYGFLVHEPVSGETAAIDTPDADEILRQAEAAGWSITQIWNTHHHWDHAGGNPALQEATGARIVAPASERERIANIDIPVEDGDIARLGAARARVLETPGHTTGHVIYHFAEDRVAFVGDTLFALGCGRLFEGTPAQMWASLSKLAALPGDTAIYCAHEYTAANLTFALSVEPDNPDLRARGADITARRARGEPTVPTTLDAERRANPFLRPGSAEIRRRLGLEDASDVDVFAEVRRRKDVFR